jgi:hypothetical protein
MQTHYKALKTYLASKQLQMTLETTAALAKEISS